MNNQLPINSYLLIDGWEFYSSFDNIGFTVNDYQRIEITRQIISHLDYGQQSITNALGNPIKYALLSNNFTEQEKEILNKVASDIMVRLYMKCCALGMFEVNQENGVSFFPYFPEHVSVGTIAFMKSSPFV